ncbi:IS200/IS605 family element transposase accessory protein TnpB [Streptomyces chlorus]|uniref:IS200/IS605 family accessory protein TnpB-related protein n=1 Tax=Streptomyces chlorus TaxID=887452 RepID=A0ABW1DQQ6_9ACTN
MTRTGVTFRPIRAPFVAADATGVAIRDRLKGLTGQDEKVLRSVGVHLGTLATRDLRTYTAPGFDRRDSDQWATRKRNLTAESSSRWAGAVTKATHDQYALARRGQLAHLQNLDAGIGMLRHRLSLPLGEKGTKRAPGGYRSRSEWFHKSRRLAVLQDRHAAVEADWQTGTVHVVRGGKRLANTRHHLDDAGLTTAEWRARWEAARWFLSADGESGKTFGNETIRVNPDGDVSLKLPAPLAHLANAPRGRYVLTARVRFQHRGEEWADRVTAGRAVAYEIHYDTGRDRWYLTASWKRPAGQAVPVDAAVAGGVAAADFNADHLAVYRLDAHGNPVGNPHRFFYDLSGGADHRDAQLRHALTQMIHWALARGLKSIAVEDLDFSDGKTREKHGRRRAFRQLVSGIPTGRLKARLVNMAAEHGLALVAVDPAYTSKWGAQHWQKPLTGSKRAMTRHDAASIAIGRRALGHPIRRRTAPPPHDQSDRAGHRTVQAGPGTPGREGNRPRVPGPRTRSVRAGRGENTVDQNAQHRSGRSAEHEFWQQDSLPLSF